MCGICGTLVLDGGRPADPQVVREMSARLAHRGPDDDGVWAEGPVALGQRRLSIIDLQGGHQPLSNEDGTIWITYNGEVYNFAELTDELRLKGHRFRTRCDTEVLVHLYEEEGPDFVKRLNGMFALGLWDARRQRLVLARDRMGQKPLYWGVFAGELLFASELKGIVAHPAVDRRLDLNSLSRYLALNAVPAPYSILQGVHKLPPAGRLVVERGQIKSDTYWSFPLGRTRLSIDVEEAEERLLDSLRAAVRRRMISDVPLGVFVSGGIDSGVIAALMCEESSHQVQSFSVAFDDPRFDESRHARTVADHLGTEHHVQRLDPRSALDLIPELCDVLDEPFADPSILPTYLLSRYTRGHVKVALGGDGCDELLAGYPTYVAHRYASRLQRLPAFARHTLLEPLVNYLPGRFAERKTPARIRKLLAGLRRPGGVARHYAWSESFGPRRQAELFTPEAWEAISADAAYDVAEAHYDACESSNQLERILYLDTRLYMQDDILVKVDRASMAVALEVRAPFLDPDVVDLLAALPLEYKLAGVTTKALLKRAARRLLPQEIIRRPKQGFALPVADWLRNGFCEQLEEAFDEVRLRQEGIFRPAYVRRLLDEHRSGHHDHKKILWSLLMFQQWHSHHYASAAPVAAVSNN